MKGIIILPKYLKEFWAPKLDGFSSISSVTGPLWYAMSSAFGFDIKYADEVDVSSNIDIVIMFGVPYHNRPKLIPGLIDLDRKIKLVMYPGDIQCYNNPVCIENKLKVFDRSDAIVSGSYEYFAKSYPQFMSKYEFLPLFFGPHDRYIKLQFNNNPNMRCLLSGSLNPQVYLLRSFIRNNSGGLIDYKPQTYAKGDAYAKLLNSYFCCVATPSIFNYAVCKYFEIPAAGSLLLAPEINDLKKAGFVPNHHYVPITKSNVIKTISQCLKNPNDYEHIRKEGMRFVRENHSVVNRVDRLKTIFGKVVDK